jgi:hypothetical protein
MLDNLCNLHKEITTQSSYYVEKVSNNPDNDCRIQEDIAADLPPHPRRLCERPARAKSQPTKSSATSLRISASGNKQRTNNKPILIILS